MSKNGKKNGKPTKEDAHLLVELYEAQAAASVLDAVGYLFSSEFPATYEEFREKFPSGSASTQERDVHRVLGYYETIGTLHRHGLINEDLLFDWLAVSAVWGKVANWVGGFRVETGVPQMYENLEYMAGKAGNLGAEAVTELKTPYGATLTASRSGLGPFPTLFTA